MLRSRLCFQLFSRGRPTNLAFNPDRSFSTNDQLTCQAINPFRGSVKSFEMRLLFHFFFRSWHVFLDPLHLDEGLVRSIHFIFSRNCFIHERKWNGSIINPTRRCVVVADPGTLCPLGREALSVAPGLNIGHSQGTEEFILFRNDRHFVTRFIIVAFYDRCIIAGKNHCFPANNFLRACNL